MTSFTLSRISSSFIFSVEVSEFSIVFSNEYLSKLNKDDEKDLDIIRTILLKVNAMFFSPSLRGSDSNWNPDDKAHFNISLRLEGLDQSPLNEALCRLPQEPLPSVLVLMVCLYFNKSFVQRLQCLGNADSVDVILFKIAWWSCQNFVF